jgi:hypothetical protein
MGSSQEGATPVAVRRGRREIVPPRRLIEECQVHLEPLNRPVRSTAKIKDNYYNVSIDCLMVSQVLC